MDLKCIFPYELSPSGFRNSLFHWLLFQWFVNSHCGDVQDFKHGKKMQTQCQAARLIGGIHVLKSFPSSILSVQPKSVH